MNKGVLACAMASIIITSPLLYHHQPAASAQSTSISGSVSPADEADRVQLVKGKDSIQAVLHSGNFYARVEPGKYKLVIHTKRQNGAIQLVNLEVKRNQALHVGEIILP